MTDPSNPRPFLSFLFPYLFPGAFLKFIILPEPESLRDVMQYGDLEGVPEGDRVSLWKSKDGEVFLVRTYPVSIFSLPLTSL
jgi:hypothetical protein